MTKKELIDLYDQYKGIKNLRIKLRIHMPDGSTEVIYNTNAHNKIEYIEKTYDENLVHKNSKDIYIVNAIFYGDAENDFSNALFYTVYLGKRVTRKAWGENVWVYHVPRDRYAPVTNAALSNVDDDGKVPYGEYLAIKSQDGRVYPFIPGMDSILANDWYVLT